MQIRHTSVAVVVTDSRAIFLSFEKNLTRNWNYLFFNQDLNFLNNIHQDIAPPPKKKEKHTMEPPNILSKISKSFDALAKLYTKFPNQVQIKLVENIVQIIAEIQAFWITLQGVCISSKTRLVLDHILFSPPVIKISKAFDSLSKLYTAFANKLNKNWWEILLKYHLG